jgi:MFS family permease
LGGRAADVYGRRRIFIVGLVLFAATSVLVGLAPLASLIEAGRAVQGAAGGCAGLDVDAGLGVRRRHCAQVFMLSLYLQTVDRYSAKQTGLLFLVQGASAVLGAALGIGVLVAVAEFQTLSLQLQWAGPDSTTALVDGFRYALVGAALVSFAAAMVTLA